jgi:predicted protein tyrosine phosphatase
MDTLESSSPDPAYDPSSSSEESEPAEDDYDWDEDNEFEDPLEDMSLHFSQLGFHEMPLHSICAVPAPTSSKYADPVLITMPDTTVIPSNPSNKRAKDEPFLIIPGLFLGSESHAKHEYMLQRIGVTHILGIHEKSQRHFPQSFDYLLFSLKDRQDVDIASVFSEAHSFIKKAHASNGVVFVHCWAGMSRSATLVISYLMQLDHISFNDAFRRVADAKPDISPNPGFIYQLRQFEKKLNIATGGAPAIRANFQGARKNRKPIVVTSKPRKSGKHQNKKKRNLDD